MSDTRQVVYVFPHPVLANDSDRYLRRTALVNLCDIGVPTVVGHCVVMGYNTSRMANGEAVLHDMVVGTIRGLAAHDENLFPGVNRQEVANLPCKLYDEVPANPDRIDWEPSDNTTSDSNDPLSSATANGDNGLEIFVERLLQFCRLVSSGQVKQSLIYRANLSPVQTDALSAMLDRLHNHSENYTSGRIDMEKTFRRLCNEVFALEDVNALVREYLPSLRLVALAPQQFKYLHTCHAYSDEKYDPNQAKNEPSAS